LLIVDDIQQNIDLLSVLLTRDGHTLFTARDGQQALIRMASETDIDAVLMDIQMPVMDGLAACMERRIFEKNNGLPRTPIIALTASVLTEDKQAAHDAGMDGFANKPIDYQCLTHEIARALQLDVAVPKHPEVNEGESLLIDKHKGISLWGSKEEYYHQLNYFVQQQEANFIYLRACIEQKNWTSLKPTVHKLKGICGNLSLTSLMMKLEALENTIDSHFQSTSLSQSDIALEHVQECEIKTDAIQALYSEVKVRVSKVINVQRYPGNLNHTDSKSSKKETLSELEPLLETLKNEANENEVNEESLAYLLKIVNTPYSLEINQVYQALNDFEFSQAEHFIDALLLKIRHN
jgi:CheY-like chemotaxis protein